MLDREECPNVSFLSSASILHQTYMDHAIQLIDFGSVGQKEADDLHVPVLGGLVQGRVLAPVGIDLGPAGEHPEHGVPLALGAGRDEGELQGVSVHVSAPLLVGQGEPLKGLSTPAEKTEVAIHKRMASRGNFE